MCGTFQSFLPILSNVPSTYYVHRHVWPQLWCVWSVWYEHIPYKCMYLGLFWYVHAPRSVLNRPDHRVIYTNPSSCMYQHTSQLCTTSDLFSTAPTTTTTFYLHLANTPNCVFLHEPSSLYRRKGEMDIIVNFQFRLGTICFES